LRRDDRPRATHEPRAGTLLHAADLRSTAAHCVTTIGPHEAKNATRYFTKRLARHENPTPDAVFPTPPTSSNERPDETLTPNHPRATSLPQLIHEPNMIPHPCPRSNAPAPPPSGCAFARVRAAVGLESWEERQERRCAFARVRAAVGLESWEERQERRCAFARERHPCRTKIGHPAL
jgi:hypothetical protein